MLHIVTYYNYYYELYDHLSASRHLKLLFDKNSRTPEKIKTLKRSLFLRHCYLNKGGSNVIFTNTKVLQS